MKNIRITILSCLALVLSVSMQAQEDNQTSFGEEISAENAISFADFYEKMSAESEMETKIRGTVSEVCQVKGCWMTMVEGDKELFIKFKDYAFFMPLDIIGKEVVIEGKAFREVVSVDELRHMAEDGGKSKEEIMAITEPKEELRFMANGVLIVE